MKLSPLPLSLARCLSVSREVNRCVDFAHAVACAPRARGRAATALARDADGRLTAFLGSANLVRGSMNLPVWLRLLPFDELNVLVREPAFCARLDGAMDELFARAQPVEPAQRLVAASGWYSARSAWLDELWQ